MMNKLSILLGIAVACSFVLSVKADSTADVGFGTVDLPNGFKQVVSEGIDSVCTGSFVSADGKQTIYYDVGGLAGIYVAPGKVKDRDFYTEFPVGDRTAAMLISGKNEQSVTISIGTVNFFGDVKNKAEIETIKTVARSYVPYPVTTPRDNVFERSIQRNIADEMAGNAKYQKAYWQGVYRKLRSQTGVGWEPTSFRGPQELIAFIWKERAKHNLPLYDE